MCRLGSEILTFLHGVQRVFNRSLILGLSSSKITLRLSSPDSHRLLWILRWRNQYLRYLHRCLRTVRLHLYWLHRHLRPFQQPLTPGFFHQLVLKDLQIQRRLRIIHMKNLDLLNVTIVVFTWIFLWWWNTSTHAGNWYTIKVHTFTY